MIAVSITVKGLVQGVFFRKFTKQKATELGLTGFVRNNSDGSVYIEAFGEADKIAALQEWCKSGPKAARVDDTIVNEIKAGSYSRFEIKNTI